MTSFESAKSEIVGSALGSALSMSTNTSWSDVVTKIKGVVNRGNLYFASINTTYSVPAGYYSGGDLDTRPSYNQGWSDGVYTADNRSEPNSLNYKTGYNAGYSAGHSQGVTDADNRANSSSTNYITGYNNGYSAGYNDANNIQWISGQVGTSSYTFNTSWTTGRTQNTYFLNIGLGWQPALIAAYCTSNSSHWVIRYHDTCVAAGNGCGTCTNLGNFSWNSSNAQIPTMRTTSTTWNFYACGYN